MVNCFSQDTPENFSASVILSHSFGIKKPKFNKIAKTIAKKPILYLNLSKSFIVKPARRASKKIDTVKNRQGNWSQERNGRADQIKLDFICIKNIENRAEEKRTNTSTASLFHFLFIMRSGIAKKAKDH